MNEQNRIYLGPPREGAKEMVLFRNRSQGRQIVLATTGTEYDENYENRPSYHIKGEQVSTIEGKVELVTFEQDDTDGDDNDLEVIVYNIVKANAAAVGKYRDRNKK